MDFTIKPKQNEMVINKHTGSIFIDTGFERMLRNAGIITVDVIGAIVSRSGRPDLAGLDYLKLVKAPTLLIVGGNDNKKVIDLNKEALKQLGSEKKKMVVVHNATHLFEEPGTLEEVARLVIMIYVLRAVL